MTNPVHHQLSPQKIREKPGNGVAPYAGHGHGQLHAFTDMLL